MKDYIIFMPNDSYVVYGVTKVVIDGNMLKMYNDVGCLAKFFLDKIIGWAVE